MKKQSPGITFMQRFVYGGVFGGFIDYMNRPEAFDKSAHINDKLYSGYLNYMSNEEKSDGIFTLDSDRLNDMELEKQKDFFNASNEKGCPLYQGVISFNNDFLKDYGIMTDSGIVHYDTLKNISRKGITTLIKNCHLDENNLVWTGAIHTNTDNIHIHIAMIEKEKVSRKYDRIEKDAFDKLKSKVANAILGDKYLVQISELYRNKIIPDILTESRLQEHPIFRLLEKLPEDIPLQYGRKEMDNYRKYVDKCVDEIIKGSPELKNSFKEFHSLLDIKQAEYRRAYGDGEQHLWKDFKPNKIKDFYSRAGNSLLSEIKKFGLLEEYTQLRKENQRFAGSKNNRERFICSVQRQKTMHSIYLGMNSTMRRNIKDYDYHIRQLMQEFEQEQERQIQY